MNTITTDAMPANSQPHELLHHHTKYKNASTKHSAISQPIMRINFELNALPRRALEARIAW
jgi:hypothetical protein